jgi:hypothetical protein
MELEVDRPLDGISLDGVIGLTFESTPDETALARKTVLFAYAGCQGGGGVGNLGGSNSFPGPNPISMDPEHLETVKREEYVVSAKTDGTRYQIVAVQDKVVLVDRTMRCLTATYSALPPMCFVDEGTVLDAELVFVGKRNLLYVFDVVMVGGIRQVSSMPYTERMSIVEDLGRGLELGFGTRVLVEILPKPIFPKHRAHEVMTDPVSVGIVGSTDGIVFTPVKMPIQIRTHWAMYKVKLHHTLDFRLVLVPHKFGTQESAAQPSPTTISSAIVERMRNDIIKNALTPDANSLRPGGSGRAGAGSGGGGSSSGSGGGAGGSSGSGSGVGGSGAGGGGSSGSGSGAGGSGSSGSGGTSGGTTPAAAGSLLAMVGRKRNATTRFGPSMVSGAAVSTPVSKAPPPAPPAPPRMQWIPRLEYSNSGITMLDATTQGIEYGGYTVVLRIIDDETFNALLDRMEETYRGIDGQVVSLSVIVECNMSISPEHFAGGNPKILLPVKIERTRPDKHEPNSFLTITRTITSILHGVMPKHLVGLTE